MENEDLRRLLNDVQNGSLDVADALAALETAVDAGPAIAEVDTDRLRRTGHPEVVFGQGKEAADIVAILRRIASAKQPGIVTRLDDQKAEAILREIPTMFDYQKSSDLVWPKPLAF